MGLYRYRKIKCVFSFDNLHPFVDSMTIFNNIVPKFIKLGFVDKEHRALGEEIGIRREWYCDDLGEKEVLLTCYEAYIEICNIMIEAHAFFDLELVPQGFPQDFLENIHIILESDLDPTLPKKWGWI